ncbi:HNH endonuclease [Spiroplasma attinicola]|uniref:HNH endonuclease n=1 Tax=Spiroplasma attinicola TaxID=2904537 RepID=UPI002022A499|nr:HNH endonuclease [Spiroplasma sp. JKS002670]MCL8209626.1 hypothetical protein [Spiroplasma sp. JKS002670]
MKEKINYYEIIDYQINDLGFKNPQYKQEYFPVYWNIFWDLFEKNFSKRFQFNKPNSFTKRVIYLLAKDKVSNEEVLFILSLPEGHMRTTEGKFLARLKFQSKLLKEYIKENNAIFYLTFYAPLKKNSFNEEEALDNTDFDNSIFIVSTLQEIWNCSEKYGERYKAILCDKPTKQQEWISVIINYKKLLFFIKAQKKAVIQDNIIKFENNKWLNQNKEGILKHHKENISYNLIKNNYVNNCINQLIEKNNDFIQWIDNKSFDMFDNEADNISYYESKKQIQNIFKNKIYSKTYRESLIKSRVGQGIFRENLLQEFNGKCIFTEINIPTLLIASHVKPWNKSNDQEKLDWNNGLLLSPTFDKLFDKGFISFTDDSKLLISRDLSNEIIKELGIEIGKKYNLKLNDKKRKYLKFHRINIFKK